MIKSVSACGCSYTAVSTATRGRVTRSAAPRNNCSSSKVVDTIRSVAHFLESIKNGTQAAAFDLVFTPGRRNVTGLAAKGVGLRRIGVDRALCADPFARSGLPAGWGLANHPRGTPHTRADLALPLAQQAAEASEKLDAKSPETAKLAARVRLRSAFTSHARPLNCRQGVAQQVPLTALGEVLLGTLFEVLARVGVDGLVDAAVVLDVVDPVTGETDCAGAHGHRASAPVGSAPASDSVSPR